MAEKPPTLAARIRALKATLNNGSPGDRVAAAAALGELADKRCYTPLASALKSGNPQVAAAAAAALSGGWDDRALSALISREADVGPAATAAIETLIAAVGHRAVPGLIGGVASNKPRIAQASTRRLRALSSALSAAELADGLILAMTIKSPTGRKQIPTIAQASLPAPELLRVCVEALGHHEVRARAPALLKGLGAPGVEALVAVVEAGPGEDRNTARSGSWVSCLQALCTLAEAGALPRARALPLLRAATTMDSAHCPSCTMRSLMAMGERPWVLAQLESPLPPVRSAVLHTLTVLRERELAPLMSQSLSDPDSGVRRAATAALRYCGSADQTPALIEALADSSPYMRVSVVDALGAMGDASALAPLTAQLERETEPWIIERYRTAIRRLGG